MASSVGISYKNVVWQGPEWREKFLKNILEGMPRVDPRGPLGGPLGGSEGKKDVRTRSANWWRSNLALGRDRAPRSMTSTMKETKKLSSYVGW